MARSGRFGRLPRVAPDLTSAIVAMMREYDNYREQGIVDAWKNGGTFDGKPVTDDMVTGFYEKRLKDLSPKDPQYENTKNTVTQYGFSIANSKQELAYAQHKVDDASMVAFYTSWAGKMPPDSEAYRNLMKLAAQYGDRARTAAYRSGGGGGGSANAKAAAYNAKVVATYPGMVVYNTLKSVIEALARKEGILGPASDDPTKTETLANLEAYQGDNGRLIALVNALATSPEYKGVRDQITAWLHKNGAPGFNGDFSWQAFIGSRSSYAASLQQQMALAQAAGKTEDYNRAVKDYTAAIALGGKLALVPATKTYEESYVLTDNILSKDSTADPFTKWAAIQNHKDVVTDLAKQASDVNNALGFGGSPDAEAMQGLFTNELRALNGEDVKGGTVFKPSGGAAGTAGETSDAAETAAAVRTVIGQMTSLLAGGSVLTMVDAKGNPTPAGTPGATLQPVATSALAGGDVAWVPSVGAPATVTMPPNPDGSVSSYATGSVLTAVVGQTVNSVGTVYDDAGRPVATIPLKAGTSSNVGSVYTMPDGSQLYGYFDKDGNKRYTYQNPFASPPKSDGKGGWVTGPPNLALPQAGAKTEYDPVMGYNNDFYTQPDSVSAYHSLYTAWMMGTKGDGGKAVYAASRTGTDLALAHEFGLGVDPKTGAYVGSDQQMALYTAAKGEVDVIRASVIRGDSDIQTQIVTNWSRGIGQAYSAMGEAEMAAVGAATQRARTGEYNPATGTYGPSGGTVPESYSGSMVGTPNYSAEEKYFRDRGMALVADAAHMGLGAVSAAASSMPVEQFRKWVYDQTGKWMTDVALFGTEPTTQAGRTTIEGSWQTGYRPVPGAPGIPTGAQVVPVVMPQPGTNTGTLPPVQGPPNPTPPAPPPVRVTVGAPGDEAIGYRSGGAAPPPPPPPPPPVAPTPTYDPTHGGFVPGRD